MDILGLTSEEWVQIGISLGIVVVALVLTRPILNFILDKIFSRFTNWTSSNLDDVVIAALRPPLYWVVVAIAIQIGFTRIEFTSEQFSDIADDVFFVLFSLLVMVSLWRVISQVSDWYAEEVAPKTDTTLDEQIIPFAKRILLILLVAIVAIIVLGYFEVEISGLVATLGIGSLAIALAAQAALSDTISGFMIMIDQPFRIGDRIEIAELNTWGDVVDIGLRSTRIRTRDNRMVIIPNSVIAKSLVVNHAYPDVEYRIQVHIGVAYGTDLEYARETIVNAVRQVEGVLPHHPVEALFLEFGDSALIFRVRWWIETYVDTRRMFDKVNTAVYYALEQANIEVPPPQIEVFHKTPPQENQ
jgi:small-conductance mechanosensitive channel